MVRDFLFRDPSLAPIVPKGTTTTGSTRLVTVSRCGESDDEVAAEKCNDDSNGEATHFAFRKDLLLQKVEIGRRGKRPAQTEELEALGEPLLYEIWALKRRETWVQLWVRCLRMSAPTKHTLCNFQKYATAPEDITLPSSIDRRCCEHRLLEYPMP